MLTCHFTIFHRLVKLGSLSAFMFLLGFHSPCNAVDSHKLMRQFTHSSWGGKEGIPGPVRAIAQTRDGYLWLGTDTGLYRYDGIHFVLWEPSRTEELPGSAVQSLCLARDGSLWIGFRNGAIGRLQNGHLRNFIPASGSPRGKILSLAEDDHGAIWAAGQYAFGRIENGLWHRIGTNEGYIAPAAQAVLADSRGNLWVATDGYSFSSIRDTPERNTILVLHKGEHHFALTGAAVSFVPQIAEAPDGTIWITQESHPSAIRIAPDTGRLHSIESLFDWPYWLLFDRENTIWVGLAGEGLRRFSSFRTPQASPSDRFEASEGLSGGIVYCAFEDHEGNIWVGTERGLDRFSDNKLTPSVLVKDPGPASQLGLASTKDGVLWMYKYSDEGLYLYHDGKISRATWPARVPVGRRILSIYPENDHAAWVGGDFGLAHAVNGKLSFHEVAGNLKGGPVEAITEATDGSLWISFWGADSVERPMRYFRGVWTDFRKSADLPKYRCRILQGDSEGRMWLGYEDGEVAVFDNRGFRVYSSQNGLTGGQINAIYEDSRRQIWVATDGGLSRFHDNDFISLTAKNGLPGRSLSGVLEDADGTFWLAGSTGILKTTSEELNKSIESGPYQIKGSLLDAGDGLGAMPRQKEPFPVMTRTRDGRMWFSTTAGVFTLDPRRMPQNRVVPPVVIQQLEADGKEYPATSTSSPSLRANTKTVQFDYTALSLTAPERVRFRYKLEGFDTGWSTPASAREATYTNLPPREYRFQVIACNNDGVWNHEGAEFRFSIAPAFYQTNWFILVCTAVLALLVWAASQWRVRQAQARVHLQMEERLSERARIARELHDTLLQSFQGLILNFQRARNHLPGRPSEAMASLDRALDRAESAIIEGREAIHDIRSSATVIGDLSKGLSALGAEIASENGSSSRPTFTVVVEGTPREIDPQVRDQIYRIAREALRNAYYHAQARKIEVEISYDAKQLRIRVRDDGTGIDEKHLQGSGRSGHYGLRGMRERAAEIGGTLDFWTEQGAGTEIELKIPYRIAHTANAPSGSEDSD